VGGVVVVGVTTTRSWSWLLLLGGMAAPTTDYRRRPSSAMHTSRQYRGHCVLSMMSS
jgi:hypothetical protein